MKTAQDVIDSLNLKARPKGLNLFVLPLVQASQTFLVDAGENRELPEPGIVVAVGPGRYGSVSGALVPVDSQIGELVWFGKWSGISLDLLSGDGNPVRVLVVPDDLGQAGQDPGTFELVIHDDNYRRMHLKGWTCEHCPSVKEAGLKELQTLAGLEPRSPFADLTDTSPEPGRLVAGR